MTFPASSSAAAAVVFAVPLVALVSKQKEEAREASSCRQRGSPAAVSLRVMLLVVVSEQLLSEQTITPLFVRTVE